MHTFNGFQFEGTRCLNALKFNRVWSVRLLWKPRPKFLESQMAMLTRTAFLHLGLLRDPFLLDSDLARMSLAFVTSLHYCTSLYHRQSLKDSQEILTCSEYIRCLLGKKTGKDTSLYTGCSFKTRTNSTIWPLTVKCQRELAPSGYVCTAVRRSH